MPDPCCKLSPQRLHQTIGEDHFKGLHMAWHCWYVEVRCDLSQRMCFVFGWLQKDSILHFPTCLWLKRAFPPGTLVAFHPRPQIASDLGRNVTRNFNPHRNRSQFPSGNEILAYGRRFKSQPASTRCDLRIASPTRPFLQVIWTPQIANPQAAIAELGPPGGRKIAESPATRLSHLVPSTFF